MNWTGDLFKERLKQLREHTNPVRSMTVTSQFMGLGPNSLRRYEMGEREPKASVLIKMADYYHVSVDYLLGRTNY